MLLLVFIALSCSSWGFLVHRSMNQLAVYVLPDEIAPFFYDNMSYLVRESVRPDQRRNKDSTEAPRHFIDFEAYDPEQLAAWKMPFKFEAAVQKYTRDTLEKYGYVPYQVIKSKMSLTEAFRSQNKDSILFHAADLSHYIGDAHVPFHTTLNYDGQLTGQKGIHSLWESMIPEIYLDQFQLYTKYKVTYLADPEKAIWDAVRSAHLLLDDMFKSEVAVAQNFPGDKKYRVQVRNGRTTKSYHTEFAAEYYQRVGKKVNMQMLLAVNLIADFWYTSWVDAGKPPLDHLLSKNPPKKRSLKAERAAYKKNKLIKKGLLISRAGAEKKKA